MNRNNNRNNVNNLRYNLPMFDIKHWYEHELEAVGHLAAMKDGMLRRRYATKVSEGMKHLIEAIQERMENSENSDKRLDLTRMAERVGRAREHIMEEYGIEEGNLSYGWNLGPVENAGAAGVAGLAGAAAAYENSYNMGETEEENYGNGNTYENNMGLENLEGEEEYGEPYEANEMATGELATSEPMATGELATGELATGESAVTTTAPTNVVNPFGINLGTGTTATGTTNLAAPAPAPSFMNTLMGFATGTTAPAPAPATNLVGGRRRKTQRKRKGRTQRKRKQRKTRSRN